MILFCSVVALFIFLKKVFQFHREEINVGELLRGLFNVLRRDGFVEALTLCDHTPGPAARLLAAAIRAYERNGFKLFEKVKVDIGGGFYMDDYIYQHAL